jgi:hypothetical protein
MCFAYHLTDALRVECSAPAQLIPKPASLLSGHVQSRDRSAPDEPSDMSLSILERLPASPLLPLACKLPSGRFLSGQKDDCSYLMWTSDRWLVKEVRVAVSSLPLAAPWSSL